MRERGVLKGDATGYAYTEDLSADGLLKAAATAAAIARSGDAPGPIELHGRKALDLYPVAHPIVDEPADKRLSLLRQHGDLIETLARPAGREGRLA